jgi:Flp pilus assembly protein TadD
LPNNREAIRLKPDNAEAHYNLGAALESEGQKEPALGEYRRACELDSRHEAFCADYERLSKELKK